MERSYFFSGQGVEAEDLNNISDTLCEQMQNRTIDFFSKGVVGTSSNYVLVDTKNTIKINPFVAYVNDGNRIYVYKTIKGLALDLRDDTERRLTQQGDLDDSEFGWIANTTYDIYVSYLDKASRPRAHVKSGEFFPTRIVSGFEFYAMRPGIDRITNLEGKTNLVRLCRLVWDGETLTITTDGYLEHASIDASSMYVKGTYIRPSTYNPTVSGAQTNVADHIYCIGSGTPTPTNPHGLTPKDIGFEDTTVSQHIIDMHSTGLTVADRQSYSSGFFIAVNSNNDDTIPDNLILFGLNDKEFLHYRDITLTNYAYTGYGYVYLQFTYGTYPAYTKLPNGNYTICIDPNTGYLKVASDNQAAVGKTLRVTAKSYDDAESTGTLIDNITIQYANAAFFAQDLFKLAKFYFSTTKATSYIKTNFATDLGTSNFITKEDLRIFGSTPVSSLETTKETFTDVLTLPYTVVVDSLRLAGGAVITGDSVLPTSYIQGFNISSGSDNTILVTPGVCRDDSGAHDIVLSNNIVKIVDKQWVPGGIGAAVGGLQNHDVGESSELPKPGGYGLHVFVIMDDEGNVDIALDTNYYGSHLHVSDAETFSYTYKRRIGTIYLSHHYGDTDPSTKETLHPFVGIPMGQGIMFYYRNKAYLEYSNIQGPSETLLYTNNTFKYTYVPDGNIFLATFDYEIPTGYKDIRRPAVTDNYVRVGGYGSFSTHITNMSMQTVTVFDTIAMIPETSTPALDEKGQKYFASNALYCVGYFDSRSTY